MKTKEIFRLNAKDLLTDAWTSYVNRTHDLFVAEIEKVKPSSLNIKTGVNIVCRSEEYHLFYFSGYIFLTNPNIENNHAVIHLSITKSELEIKFQHVGGATGYFVPNNIIVDKKVLEDFVNYLKENKMPEYLKSLEKSSVK